MLRSVHYRHSRFCDFVVASAAVIAKQTDQLRASKSVQVSISLSLYLYALHTCDALYLSICMLSMHAVLSIDTKRKVDSEKYPLNLRISSALQTLLRFVVCAVGAVGLYLLPV